MEPATSALERLGREILTLISDDLKSGTHKAMQAASKAFAMARN
jgi:hypothetical protein